MKKIISISFALIFACVLAANAQQNSASKPVGATVANAVNPNIERMRIVNEKMAAEKAVKNNAAGAKMRARQNQQEIERIKSPAGGAKNSSAK